MPKTEKTEYKLLQMLSSCIKGETHIDSGLVPKDCRVENRLIFDQSVLLVISILVLIC